MDDDELPLDEMGMDADMVLYEGPETVPLVAEECARHVLALVDEVRTLRRQWDNPLFVASSDGSVVTRTTLSGLPGEHQKVLDQLAELRAENERLRRAEAKL